MGEMTNTLQLRNDRIELTLRIEIQDSESLPQLGDSPAMHVMAKSR